MMVLDISYATLASQSSKIFKDLNFEDKDKDLSSKDEDKDTWKLVVEDPRGQGLSSRTTTLILGSWSWPFGVMWRHWSHDHKTRSGWFPIDGPLTPTLYLTLLLRYYGYLSDKHSSINAWTHVFGNIGDHAIFGNKTHPWWMSCEVLTVTVSHWATGRQYCSVWTIPLKMQ